MLNAIINYIRTILGIGAVKLNTQAALAYKEARDNVNVEALIIDYTRKTDKELSEHNRQLDTVTANLFLTEENLRKERAALEKLAKEAKVSDDPLVKANAAAKFRIVQSYESSRDRQAVALDEYRERIREAKMQRDINLANLKVVQVEMSLVNLESNMLNASSKVEMLPENVIVELQEVIAGKRALVQATQLNDRLLDRKQSTVVTVSTDEEFEKYLATV